MKLKVRANKSLKFVPRSTGRGKAAPLSSNVIHLG